MPSERQVKRVTDDDNRAYEVEIIPGIELVAIDELRSRGGGDIMNLHQTRPGFARFHFRGDRGWMRELRSVVAVYEIHQFDVPRPQSAARSSALHPIAGRPTSDLRRFFA